MFKVRMKSRLTIPGERDWNEDRCDGWQSDNFGHAWVIDGATGLVAKQYIEGARSDASWLADALQEHLRRQDPSNRALPNFQEILASLHCAYACRTKNKQVPDFALPSAAAMYVRWNANPTPKLEFSHLGDCSAVIAWADGSMQLIGSLAHGVWESHLNAKIADLNENGRDFSRPLIDQLRETVVANRQRMNQPDGYWIFGTDARAAEHIQQETVTVGSTGQILMMTDGFCRLIDPFQCYSPAGLVETAQTKGLEALMHELREVENDDQLCIRFPRIKPYDDAAALLLSIGPA